MAEHSLRFGTETARRRWKAYVGNWALDVHGHTAEWGLALLFWLPFAVSLTVGPGSILLGNRNWGANFIGLGFSLFPKEKYMAFFVSNRLWYETGLGHE